MRLILVLTGTLVFAAGCVQQKQSQSTFANPTAPSSPTPTPAAPTGTPSVTVSYALGPGGSICSAAPCNGMLGTSADGRIWGVTLATGQAYKIFAIVHHGTIAGRTIDVELVPGFNPDPGTAIKAQPETSGPADLVLGYSFTARSGSLPISVTVTEHSAGSADMAQDYVYKNNVVLTAR